MARIKVLIIGSGPAGYTAAIYAARAGLKPVLYQGQTPGGQLMITSDVENYPGFPDGILGPGLMELFQKQAERFGTDLRTGAISSVDFSDLPYKVTVDEEKVIEADSVIISTGASAKWLGLANEARLGGKGVSACAVCDGFFFKGEEVAVVGGGDTACEEANYLAKMCKHVYLIVRRGDMRASAIMQKRVQSTSNITIRWHTVVEDVLGADAVEGVQLRHVQSNQTETLAVKALFVAIGHTPNTAVFKDWLKMDEQGYIITEPDSTKTSREGVFATGDVQDKVYRQAVTAAGSGCMGALEAERYLSEQGLN